MTRHGALCTLLALVLIAVFWSVAVSSVKAETIGPYVLHDAIAIYGNDGFTAENGVVRGSGTAADPFVIEGWDIGSFQSYGIDVKNVNAHFVIKDCYLHTGGFYQIGIYLDSCVNGVIRECVCSEIGTGVYLHSSAGMLLMNNTFERSGGGGVFLDDESGSSILVNNVLTENLLGIGLGSPGDNVLVNNTCSDNVDGILLGWSSDNVLVDNTCSRNSQFGISLGSSNGNSLVNNTCADNGFGIRLDTSDDNSIVGSRCLSNDGNGIYVFDSRHNTVADSTCLMNDWFGINLENSADNVLINNTCSTDNDYGYGISIGSSDGNWIVGNDCVLNGEMGVILYGSNHNNLSDNLCSRNGKGISLYYSSHNNLTGNKCSDSVQYGIYLVDVTSVDNRLWNNTLSHNNGAGDAFDPMHVQAYDDGAGNRWNSTCGYGNSWSDWGRPDLCPRDGIVDFPYLIDGGAGSADMCPIAEPTADPSVLVRDLIEVVEGWNLHKGVNIGLVSKLADALSLLDKGAVNGALHKLMDFASMAQAQGSKKLTMAQADYAVGSAESIISVLRSPR